MGKLPAEVKMRVAQRELTLAEALAAAGLEIPEWARTGASAPSATPQPVGNVEPSASGADPESERKPELEAQKAEAAAERRNLIGGAPGTDTQPAAPRTAQDAAPSVRVDPRDAKRAEALRRAALMAKLPGDVKLRVASREITLDEALREAGINTDELDG
jgi:hypothetical protein